MAKKWQPTTVKLKWYGKKQKKVIRDAIHRAQIAEGVQLVADIRKTINTAYPPASTPGTPPHKRTGNLSREVQFWDNKRTFEIEIGVTVDALYGLFLDEGTVKMKARPFLKKPAKKAAPRYAKRVRTAVQRATK